MNTAFPASVLTNLFAAVPVFGALFVVAQLAAKKQRSNVDKKINRIDDIGSDFEESENESENENDIEQEIEKDLIIPDPFFQMTVLPSEI